MNHGRELIAIKTLSLLFDNFTVDQIAELCDTNREVSNDWADIINPEANKARAFWHCYTQRWSPQTCDYVLTFARRHFGQRANEWVYPT